MNKKLYKSMIKSIVRAIWKILFKPFVKLLPESKVKRNLIRAGGKIERRDWWKSKKAITFYVPPTPNFEVSNYLQSELQELSQIEPLLTPHSDFLHKLTHQSYIPSTILQPYTVGTTYGLILRYLGDLDFDVVFLAPWLKRGGADLGLLHHIHAQHEKGYRILLITTEDAPSSWLFRLPENVIYLNFADFSANLKDELPITLLTRLLLQTKAQTIHNINSRLGWEVFKKYGLQLNTVNKKLFVSVFCEDEVKPNVWWGYAPAYLLDTYNNIERVLCDTRWYPNTLKTNFKLNDKLFQTVYFPFLGDLNSEYQAQSNKPILWASRICKQKQPELLYEIAKKMPNQLFHIYGEVDNESLEILSRIKSLPNVSYFGKYDSFSELLEKSKYSVFLYTSKYDGLPNVLIEAISIGLPAMALNAGGISELLHEKALLPNNHDLAETIAKIQQLLSQEDLLRETWQYSHNILKSRHSWAHFIDILENIDGYFPKLSRDEFMRLNANMRILSRPSQS